MPESVVPVVLTPGDTEIQPGDWQWGEESRRLVRLLQANDLDAQHRSRPPEPGQKGVATEIILALGGSGMVAAATKVMLTWLTARSTRRITLSVDDGVGRRTLELVGEGMDEASLRAAVVAALGQPPGPDPAEQPPELPPAGQ